MRALVVPIAGDVEVVDFNENDVESWVKFVGGEHGIDFITLRESGLQVLVDDHSITDDRPRNERVTWFLKGTGRWLSEVYGTVLIVGVHPDSGETIDVHEVLTEALTAATG